MTITLDLFTALITDYRDLLNGVRQLFDANTLEEDHAARLVLLDVLRRIDQREKRTA